MSDVQSLAMLCSVFQAQGSPQDYFTLYGHHVPRSAIFAPHHMRYVGVPLAPHPTPLLQVAKCLLSPNRTWLPGRVYLFTSMHALFVWGSEEALNEANVKLQKISLHYILTYRKCLLNRFGGAPATPVIQTCHTLPYSVFGLE